ncbi:hypothetical protein [Mitsuokella sp.]|uniref:hypothetical protein n=1 Tax=Mitsuokella sp. TaxID=2049034 RepID=UPI0029E2558F|nr:hypothetical protein [Mitsuokella sp.]MDD6382085.1 hypothetical protein [Selenomonadaceae bacterium]MDY4475325.1 hypothetical protein [Mitsuokella sp.]
MATWEMMLGFEAISAGISLAAILYSMFKKDDVEVADKTVAVKPEVPSVMTGLSGIHAAKG